MGGGGRPRVREALPESKKSFQKFHGLLRMLNLQQNFSVTGNRNFIFQNLISLQRSNLRRSFNITGRGGRVPLEFDKLYHNLKNISNITLGY